MRFKASGAYIVLQLSVCGDFVVIEAVGVLLFSIYKAQRDWRNVQYIQVFLQGLQDVEVRQISRSPEFQQQARLKKSGWNIVMRQCTQNDLKNERLHVILTLEPYGRAIIKSTKNILYCLEITFIVLAHFWHGFSHTYSVSFQAFGITTPKALKKGLITH